MTEDLRRTGRPAGPLAPNCLALLLLLLSGACSAVHSNVQATDSASNLRGMGTIETPEGSMTFFVREVGGALVSDAAVIAINASGLHTLGATGDHGEYRVELAALTALNPFALVFCHQDLPCGAVLVRGRFYDYREYNVTLAPAEFY